jgi:hypothetical protein
MGTKLVNITCSVPLAVIPSHQPSTINTMGDHEIELSPFLLRCNLIKAARLKFYKQRRRGIEIVY